ncbi:MAG: hypothetical protein FWD13_04455 [Treponema sp.]|nr:hypothetical protein [Treponema sp.]
MSIQTISAWAGIITALITIANFATRIKTKKEAKRETVLLIKLVFLGAIGTIAGLVIWFIGSPILGPIVGYGNGAIVFAVVGGIFIALAMVKIVSIFTGKLKSAKIGYIITCILMAGIYWTIAWFILNDLYNHHFSELSESTRGVVANIIGWGISCVIGNTALLSIANFIDMLFQPETQ